MRTQLWKKVINNIPKQSMNKIELFFFLDSNAMDEEKRRLKRSVGKSLSDHQNDLNFLLVKNSEMNEVDWPKISQRILETNVEAIRSKSMTSTSSASPITRPAPRVNEKRYADPNPRKSALEVMFRKNVVIPFMKGVNRVLCNMQKALIPDTDCSSIDENPILPFF
jgi:hypothetical protein